MHIKFSVKLMKSRMPFLIVFIIAFILFLFFIYLKIFDSEHSSRPDKERQELIIQKATTLGDALRRYVKQHEHLPPANRWEQSLKPFLPRSFTFDIPSEPGQLPRRFAMNSRLSALPVRDVPSPYWEQVVFFESTNLQPSAADEMRSLPLEDQSKGFVVVYADGVPEYISAERMHTFLIKYGIKR
ncbi:hypothetical protein HRbin15_01271 [bacterium HR15]|nr:hypothetical protein HRbin15_01271 [bacterium HR15]